MLCELSGFGLLNMRRGGRSELQTQAEKRRGEGESRLASRLPTNEQMIPVRNATETDSLPCSPAREFATMLVFLVFLASVDDVAKSRVDRPTYSRFNQSYWQCTSFLFGCYRPNISPISEQYTRHIIIYYFYSAIILQNAGREYPFNDKSGIVLLP